MALVLSFFPNTTYDLPAFNLLLGSAARAPTIKSSKPSPLTSPALEGDVNGDGLDDLIVGAYTADTGGSIYAIKKYNVGKSYVVFGKKDTYSIELSDISSGIGGHHLGWRLSSHYNHPLIRQ
jgi:hypothetical protein